MSSLHQLLETIFLTDRPAYFTGERESGVGRWGF